jgi:hypothetical protein
MHLVHNERTKLTAAWCNTLATALVAAGAFAPAAAWLYGLSALLITPGYLFGVAIACAALGLSIHLVGRAYLGRLRE